MGRTRATPTASPLNKLTVKDLKAELEKIQLSTSGLKADLVARLEEARKGSEDKPKSTSTETEVTNKKESNESSELTESTEPTEPAEKRKDIESSTTITQENIKKQKKGSETDKIVSATVPTVTLPTVTVPIPTATVSVPTPAPVPVISATPTTSTTPTTVTGVKVNDTKVTTTTPVTTSSNILPSNSTTNIVSSTHATNIVSSTHAINVDQSNKTKTVENTNRRVESTTKAVESTSKVENKTEVEVREVPASQHAITNSLFIRNFVRPFTIPAVEELLNQNGRIIQFAMDSIRSKCWAIYETTEQADATRNAVHNLVWPVANKTKLWADFVPEEEASRFISQNQTTSRSSVKNRIVEKEKVEKEPIKTLDDLFRKTVTKPSIYYLPLTDEQVIAKKTKIL